MWFIAVEVEQETSAPPPNKNPGSAPVLVCLLEKFSLHRLTTGVHHVGQS